MKYIDSEKLIAEIERRIEETKSMKPAFDQFWAGQISAFKGAIKIAESLQQEQPEVDFEKELDRIWFDNKLGNYFDNDALDYAHIKTLCKHFYELGFKAGKK